MLKNVRLTLLHLSATSLTVNAKGSQSSDDRANAFLHDQRTVRSMVISHFDLEHRASRKLRNKQKRKYEEYTCLDRHVRHADCANNNIATIIMFYNYKLYWPKY